MIDASELLGSPQLAGVIVSPAGLYQKIESRTVGVAGPVMVPGAAAAALSNKIAGPAAAEVRDQDLTVSAGTPDVGQWGFLAVTESSIGLTTTEPPKSVGRRLGTLVLQVPRSTIKTVELAGGRNHPTYYIFGSAPFRVTFTDGTEWAFEIGRFYRAKAKRVVTALGKPAS